MKILILGDSHGRLDLVHQACVEAQALWGIEAAIQVGDFGFFPKILHHFLHEGKRRFPVPLHVIDGNHEDHAWLKASRDNGIVERWQQANLHVHARGTTCILGGACIGFLGGALHADRRQEWSDQWVPTATSRRTPGSSRVPKDPAWANWITAGDVERAVLAFNDSPPDLLVTHSCPAGIGVGMMGSMELAEGVERFIKRAGHRSGPFADCGEGSLNHLWKQLVRRPPWWVFGHFHRFHQQEVDGTRFMCVGSSDASNEVRGIRPVLYDTATRMVQVMPMGEVDEAGTCFHTTARGIK